MAGRSSKLLVVVSITGVALFLLASESANSHTNTRKRVRYPPRAVKNPRKTLKVSEHENLSQPEQNSVTATETATVDASIIVVDTESPTESPTKSPTESPTTHLESHDEKSTEINPDLYDSKSQSSGNESEDFRIEADGGPSKWDLQTYTELLLGNDKASDVPDKHKLRAMRGMMKHAWDGYKKYAWGWTAVDPVAKGLNHGGPFGESKSGGTIIDSLDTLRIMGMVDEYSDGVEWLVENFKKNFMATRNTLSVFEVTIRYLGGFLGGYTMSKDRRLLDLAKTVADGLLPAFDTPTGLPMTLISPSTKYQANYGWASQNCGILADMGTLDIEFKYLSHCLGDSKYKDLVNKIRRKLAKTDLHQKDRNGKVVPGLFPIFLNQKTGNRCTSKASIGALGDSFYEYLLKSYIMDGTDVTGKQMYNDTLRVIDEFFVQKSSSGNLYLDEVPRYSSMHKMEHLACFAPGMIALGTRHMPSNAGGHNPAYWLDMAERLAYSCRLMYTEARTGIGADTAQFDYGRDGQGLSSHSVLRPEAVESWFYLYRITKNPKYRQWAWDYARAMEKYAKAAGGYSGVRDVNSLSKGGDNSYNLDGHQQSFLLAETFKYIYLTFSEDDVIDIDKYVFNTEAHVFERF